MTRVASDDQPFPTLWVAMLGLMVAMSPLCIDVYLPALPRMAEDFGVSIGFLANSVTAYFIGLVFGQLLYGPFSDRVGRIKPMYIGMSIFILATLACLVTSNPYILFIARILQAMGACVVYVVTYACIQDTLSPKKMVKALSLMSLVMGISPIFAPLLGATLLQFFHWRVIFWVLLGYALLIIILTKLFLKETLTKEFRNTQPINQVFHQYWDLLKDKRFTLPAVGGGLLMATIYTYITASSELLMKDYQLNEHQFSIFFGLNAFAYFSFAQLNHILLRYYGLITILRIGVIIQLIPTIFLMILGIAFANSTHLAIVIACLFTSLAGLGLSQPNTGAITLAYQQHRAGMASAMQGAIAFTIGILGNVILSILPINILAKFGITSSIMVIIGMGLLWQIKPSENFE